MHITAHQTTALEGPIMAKSPGLHHITAIAGDPARNLAFYQDLLGLRLVKKTVNFDDPGTYHLYYGDEQGSPGTILTFFPWPGARPGRRGAGEATGTAFAIPAASLSWWLDRLSDRGVTHEVPAKRFGETVVGFQDPDGMSLELVARDVGDVPAEHAIRAFAGVTIRSTRPDSTGAVLSLLGYEEGPKDGDVTRWSTNAPGVATIVDVKDASAEPRHASGAGTVHHIAFRAADDAAQAAMVETLSSRGLQVTPQQDRNYFRSVYFREPGGVLFEIATDAPGFAVDEPADSLGRTLMLPQWLEPRRAAIEAALPPLSAR
jgi:glyoxalase family protein